jgi:hypothetical protein
VVSKEVKCDYDGKVAEARFCWEEGLPIITPFFKFVRRQKALHSVTIFASKLFPSFLVCLGQGTLNSLRNLYLMEPIPTDQLCAFAGLVAEGALPLLEELDMDTCSESGAVPAIVAGFQAGGCPFLNVLELAIPVLSSEQDDEDEDDDDWQPEYDEEETERNLEAIANAFEARAAAGIEPRLRWLEGNWLSHGSVEVRIRLLRVLLPSVTRLPEMNEWDLEMAMGLKDIGGPCLESFTINQDLPVLVEALGTMKSLKYLSLENSFLSTTSTDELCGLLQRHKCNFLTKLEHITLNCPFRDAAADTKRFFECVRKNKAFCSLRYLYIDFLEDEAQDVKFDVLADVFSGDLFPHLHSIELCGLRGGFASLCPALARTSYANTLKSLVTVCGFDMEEMEALANVFAGGGLHSLETLRFTCRDSAGIVCLAKGFLAGGRALPLNCLMICSPAMNDTGLEALCSAIEAGRLPALETFRFEFTCISDNGLTTLAQTIEGGHLPNLTAIWIDAYDKKMQYQEGAILLARAVAAHCLKFQYIELIALEKATRKQVKAILRTREEIKFRLKQQW